MTDEKQRQLQKGRERAARQRRREGIKRVKDYRAWLQRDVEHTRRLRAHESGIARHPGRRPRMPALPSKSDFEMADGTSDPVAA